MDLVIKGLKFIAEHPEMEQEKLVDGLLNLGCNFTFSDIDEQFPEKEQSLRAETEDTIYT
jgi:hypothetical protein